MASPSKSGKRSNWKKKSAGGPTSSLFSTRKYGGDSSENDWKKPKAVVVSSGDGSWTSNRASPSTPKPSVPQKVAKVFHLGTVLNVNYEKLFGFLAPVQQPTGESWEGSKNVYFRVPPVGDQMTVTSSTSTGGMRLIPGDILEYELANHPHDESSSQQSRAHFARLRECKPRSVSELERYVTSLVASAEERPEIVLREITKCSVGFKLVVDCRYPSHELLRLALELCQILSSGKLAGLYHARLKQLYALFRGSTFGKHLSTATSSQSNQGFQNINAGLLKDFLIHLLEFSPSQLLSVLPLLTRIEDDESFLRKILGVLAGGSSNESSGLRLPWSQLPLLPTMDEVRAINPRSARSTLPVVKQEGPYTSPEEYIDTYLRLLREDCFAGLLQGIHALRQGKVDDCDMHLWFEVSVCGVHFNYNAPPGLTLAVVLPKTKSKAPLGGSLVCFFDDAGGFDSPVWGVVSRCEEEATDNKTCVCFVDIIVGVIGASEPELARESSWCLQCARLMQGEAMVMAESPTYYKAYHPVLETLQMTDPEDVPFRDELVSVTWPKEPAPKYLKSTGSDPVTLDWSCIFEPAHAFQGLGGEIREGVGAVTSLVARGFKTSFDPSQLKAVEQAVNNRLCIIQGPPGTGKTYVGVKILQLLLSASTFPKDSPVFVITLKNHALDQFLEKCLAFEHRIVRVGGRSKNQALEAYNLHNQMAITKNIESRLEYAENIQNLSWLKDEMMEEFDAVNRCLRNFHANMILEHAPDLHLSHFLERACADIRASIEARARRLPEGVTLVELLRGRIPIWDADQASLANEVRKCVVTEMTRWMPKPDAIQTALAFFSSKKPSSSRRLHCGPDSSNNESKPVHEEEDESRKEEEERRIAYESVRQETNLESDAEATSSTSKQWLASSNFMKFSKQEYCHRPSMTYHRINLDAMGGHFDWLAHENPYDLSGEHRALLVYKYWQESVNRACERLTSIKAAYDTLLQDIEQINKCRKLAVLRRAKIIGMTTTGAAMHRSMVKLLAPTVVLVEEAAEILEPQVLASLNPGLQHLILIGDHHQLRPQVESYDLERRHGFGVSMFERLAEHNRLPFQPLVLQCRMRDEFVPMLLPIYPFLQSHTALVSGSRNEAPACMVTTMHFWSHRYPETSQRSFVNREEALMVVALTRWIASELHSPESLKILAAYNGQVTLIRKLLGNHPSVDKVEVRSIDSFQGAESDIVIVSLVRSNKEGNIGHLSMRNRLCVSASRARCGVYFVGNHTTLTKKSEHWRTLIGYLKGQNALDSCVALCCPRHPDRPPFALSNTAASQFKPSDVCGYPCDEVLPCAHVCRLACHSGVHGRCKEPVDFTFRPCGHSMTKMCHQDEQYLSCKTKVIHRFTPCEHSAEKKCWEVTGIKKLPLKCQVICGKERECGHMCKLPCSENCASAPCEDCQEIEKEKEKIKLQILIKAIDNKRKELDEEILKLREKVDEGIVVQEVHPDGDTAQSYFMAKDRAEKYTQPDCKTVVAITKVQKIENLGLQGNFLKAQRELFDPLEVPAWLFYGGSDDTLDKVVNMGFRRHGKAHHFHVYSSSAAEKHCNLLLCEVLLGKTWRAPSLESLDNNFDGKKLREKGYDSVSLVGGHENGEESRPFEHVVYQPEQAIPRFLVSYKLMNLQALAEANEFERFGEEQACTSGGMCRLPLLPSLHFEGLTPEECHFRMAESQFFRMSRNRTMKVTKVEFIKNVDLEEKYNKKMQEFKASSIPAEARFVFHGTDAAAIGNIAAEGFRIGGTEGIEIKNGAVYGHGVYTASNPDRSVAYCKGSNMMLLSIAIPGKLGEHHNIGGTKDVLVIKDVCQLLPRYVVHYT